MATSKEVSPTGTVQGRILLIRGQRVITVNSQIAQKLALLEQRLADHDDQILLLVRAIKELAAPPQAPSKRKIGFDA